MKIKKKFRYDFTGLPCKHCNVILSDKNHSNRSKLTKKLRDIFNSSETISNKIVMSCGSSVSAASLALAYSLINDDYIPKIYIGSWTEFGKE